MSWDVFLGFDKFNEELHDATWERLLAAYAFLNFVLPRNLPDLPDKFVYLNNPPPGSTHWILLGSPQQPVQSNVNHPVVDFWTVQFPFEINKLAETPEGKFPHNYFASKARYIWKEGVSPENEKHLNMTILQWMNEWRIHSDQSADPTIRKELRRPRAGDYMGHFWKNWLTIVFNMQTRFTIPFARPFNPPSDIGFGSLVHPFPRYRPNEGRYGQNFGIFSAVDRYGRIYDFITPRFDIQDAPLIIESGRPLAGDYIRPQLVIEAILALKKMKHTQDSAVASGTVDGVSEKWGANFQTGFPEVKESHPFSIPFTKKNLNAEITLPVFGSVPARPGSAYEQWFIPPFSNPWKVTAYVNGRYNNIRDGIVPIGAIWKSLMIFRSEFHETVTHGLLGKEVFNVINDNVEIRGDDFTPEFDTFVGMIEPTYYHGFPWTNTVNAFGYTEWSFTHV